jgi:hypothetical protein
VAEPVSVSQVDLSWTDNASDESGFKIERATLSEGLYRHIMTLGPNAESFNDVGLSESTTYYYKVRAFNAAGDSAYSNEDNTTTRLAGPADLSASSGSYNRISLSWTDNSQAELGFRIERKLGSAGTYSEIATVGEDETTYDNTNLEPSTSYYYRVNAYNGDGNSEYSNEAHATTSALTSAGGGDGDVGDLSSTNVDEGALQPAGGGGGGGCFIGTVAHGSN